jgi:hypothetical protein
MWRTLTGTKIGRPATPATIVSQFGYIVSPIASPIGYIFTTYKTAMEHRDYSREAREGRVSRNGGAGKQEARGFIRRITSQREQVV